MCSSDLDGIIRKNFTDRINLTWNKEKNRKIDYLNFAQVKLLVASLLNHIKPGTLGELINRRVLLDAGVAPENYASTQISISQSRIEAGSKESNFIQSALNYFVPIVV